MTPTKRVPVIETFPAIQGEGAMLGQRTFFVRFGLCDYRCSWCDSMYAVLPQVVKEQASYMTQDELANLIFGATLMGDWITFSGGNPAIHDLTPLLDLLHLSYRHVQVETQGTVFRGWLADVDQLTVSPKPPSSNMVTDFPQLWEFMGKTSNVGDRCLKVVIMDDRDYEYARKVRGMYSNVSFYLSVGNPETQTTHTDVLRQVLCSRLAWLTDKLLADTDPLMRDVLVTPQLHVLAHGNKRGV